MGITFFPMCFFVHGRSMTELETALGLAPDLEPALRMRHAVRCHLRLEEALEARGKEERARRRAAAVSAAEVEVGAARGRAARLDQLVGRVVSEQASPEDK